MPNSSVSDGSASGSEKRGRLVSILEKCLLSGNEDKLMRVIESVIPSANMPLSRLLFCLPVVGSLLVLLPSTSVLLPFWRTALQHHYYLAEMHPVLQSTTVCYSMHPRCALTLCLRWTWCLLVTSFVEFCYNFYTSYFLLLLCCLIRAILH